jgi:hypothetical protein
MIIYSKNQAIEEGEKCLKHNKKKSNASLLNTMNYIFDVLHHSCYFLCVYKNAPFQLFKLENKTSPPIFEKAFKENVSRGLFQKLKPQQEKHILQTISNPFRVMQCIVKPIKDDSTFSKEYEMFLSNLKMLPGLYILNLTDAVILKSDGKMPSPLLAGVSLSSLGINSNFLPILSLSGQRGYLDIPVPNYDDIMFNKKPEFITRWSSKKARAVFRGGPTGCGVTPETNSRIKLATMRSPDLDVGLVATSEFAQTIDTKSVRIDPKYGLGMLNTGIKPVKKISMVEQSGYKYLIHIDGNVNAYRLLTTMLTGSLILRVESEYTSWLDGILKPWIHYIPVKKDLSDLLTTIRWCKEHDKECEQLAQNSLTIALQVSDKEFVETYFETVLNKSSSSSRSSNRASTSRSSSSSSSSSSRSSSKGSTRKIIQKTGLRCPNGYSVDKKDKTKCNKK